MFGVWLVWVMCGHMACGNGLGLFGFGCDLFGLVLFGCIVGFVVGVSHLVEQPNKGMRGRCIEQKKKHFKINK
jgi:hypothetical protein